MATIRPKGDPATSQENIASLPYFRRDYLYKTGHPDATSCKWSVIIYSNSSVVLKQVDRTVEEVHYKKPFEQQLSKLQIMQISAPFWT